jgi:hypothetical protein
MMVLVDGAGEVFCVGVCIPVVCSTPYHAGCAHIHVP